MVFNEKHTKLPIKKTPNFVIVVMFVVHILDLFLRKSSFVGQTVPHMELTIHSLESFIYVRLARV